MGSDTNFPKTKDESGANSPESFAADSASDADLSSARFGPVPPLGQTIPVKRRNRIPVASLTARILAINVLALAIVVAGFFYLDRYQSNLFDAKLAGLAREGGLIAGALGESVFRRNGVARLEAVFTDIGPDIIDDTLCKTGRDCFLYDRFSAHCI